MKYIIHTLLLSILLFSCKKETIVPNEVISNKHIVQFDIVNKLNTITIFKVSGLNDSINMVTTPTIDNMQEYVLEKGDTITIAHEGFMANTNIELNVYIDHNLVFSKKDTTLIIFSTIL